MNISNLLLIIITICGLISYIPQIVKITITHKSEDISLVSWLLWCISNLCYIGYSIMSGDVVLIVTCSIEAIACMITLILSVKFSKKLEKFL